MEQISPWRSKPKSFTVSSSGCGCGWRGAAPTQAVSFALQSERLWEYSLLSKVSYRAVSQVNPAPGPIWIIRVWTNSHSPKTCTFGGLVTLICLYRWECESVRLFIPIWWFLRSVTMDAWIKYRMGRRSIFSSIDYTMDKNVCLLLLHILRKVYKVLCNVWFHFSYLSIFHSVCFLIIHGENCSMMLLMMRGSSRIMRDFPSFLPF